MKFFSFVTALCTIGAALAVSSTNAATKLPSTVRADSDCATFCRFRLCVMGNNGVPIPLPTGFGLPFSSAFVAESPFICSVRGPMIGRVVRTGEARVRIRSGRFVRIARFGRNSLRQRFNSRFYATQDFDLPEFEGLSAIRRSKFRSSDQRTVLENRCVFLPLSAWEVVRRNGMVRNIVTSRDQANCVSFLATGQNTQIKVLFTWDTAADLDLSLTEAQTGEVIDFANMKSDNGGFLFEDTSLGICSMDGGARQSVEMIEYSGLSTPPDGTYTVSLAQFATCDGLDTNYQVTVMVGDDTVVDETGVLPPLGPDDEAGTFRTITFDFMSS